MQHLCSIVIVFCAVLAVATADYRQDALDLHNQYRKKHNSPPLALSDKLNNVAQNWAQNMADSNEMEHSNGKYGENLYMSSNTKLSDSAAVLEATTQWYNENKKYNYRFGKFSSGTGHFTQVVWKSSKYMGIGVARSSRGVYVCANYDPKGNFVGEFIQNVLKA
ncbi:hypothetical protein HA402_015315 [Bradysia odoriphaga]|nr:hypothetical protein HA402_015315 [Bradysia odoriphaga]